MTGAEQKAILRAAAGNPRDHLIFSMACVTGLRLAELIELNVGAVFAAGRTDSHYLIAILFDNAIAARNPFCARSALTCAFCLAFRFRR